MSEFACKMPLVPEYISSEISAACATRDPVVPLTDIYVRLDRMLTAGGLADNEFTASCRAIEHILPNYPPRTFAGAAKSIQFLAAQISEHGAQPFLVDMLNGVSAFTIDVAEASTRIAS